MRTLRPLFLLGAMSAAVGSAYAADPSQWKCESCPFDKDGVAATVDAGVGYVSRKSDKFGDYSGLDRKGEYLLAGGAVNYRGASGFYAGASGSDLGLQSRSAQGEVGYEGVARFRLGYSEIPRRLSEGALSPFEGTGTPVLTLPGGYPQATTATMPLGSTLGPVDIKYKRDRFDAGATAFAGQAWTFSLNWHRDVRSGTQRTAGSFFANTTQLIAPLDQTTDQLEAATSYRAGRFQATLSGMLSAFRNRDAALTWSNPFSPITTGATTGQLALAPDNRFWQVAGSAGWDIVPRVRASADVAFGRMTQDDPFLAPTLNATLAPTAQAAMPATSLDGQVNTMNAAARLTATPIDALRLNLSYVRDQRKNETPSRAYPAVSTDAFLGTTPRENQPFGFTQNRVKFDADYRVWAKVRAAVGVDQDNRDRTLQEVVTTRETTYWGKLTGQARDDLSASFKYAYSDRTSSTYGVAAWIDPAENPLMRKYNLAARKRNKGTFRADAAVSENFSVGFNIDIADDDYRQSTIGLRNAHSVDYGADAAVAINDQTQVFLYAQSERLRSLQRGSQTFAQPDWTAHNTDLANVAGVGVKYSALKGKLDLGGDVSIARLSTDVRVDAGASAPAFPHARTSRDALKLRADYRVKDNWSVLGTYWYERYTAQDWHLDGVLPGTIPNMLALGEQAPHYRVHFIGVTLRYRL